MTHEQGHNLGLRHASSRECINQARARGDVVAAVPGHRVRRRDRHDGQPPGGSLQRQSTSPGWAGCNSAATVTSHPQGAARAATRPRGRGVKAIRLRARGATYWLEYRTRDRAGPRRCPAVAHGVQIRYQAGDQTQLLDAGPGSTAGFYDFADVHLPAGSSWTTPQNVRITVVRQAPSSGDGRLQVPGRRPQGAVRPGPRARPGPGRRGPDHVDSARRPRCDHPPLRDHPLRRGRRGPCTTFAGLRRSYTWTGLDPSTTYRFSVQAVNEAGMSTKATSAGRAAAVVAPSPSILPSLPPER